MVQIGADTSGLGVRYVKAPPVEYPAMSKRLDEQGRVIVRILVDVQGLVERAEVKKSSGYPRLDAAALAAMRKAQFTPYVEDGVKRRFIADAPLTFSLSAPPKEPLPGN